jgi:DNA-binding NarL/FixJ family response regulator
MSALEPPTSARPRILLVDDHRAFLEQVSQHLDRVFDIVGLASDGHEALYLARRLTPDLVVLDVAMPGLNGFQTLEQLRRHAPDTRAVFLTMHRDDEFVAAAINAGAFGYVLKSRISVDLIPAISHALVRRLFLPSLAALSMIRGSRHAVHFHANDTDYLDGVCELVAATLRSGEKLVMAASEATRTGVAQRLRARHIDVALLSQRGQYLEHDSALALSWVMNDGRPDEERLRESMQTLERWRSNVPHGSRPSQLTIIGDISASLCLSGDFGAALEMERIWNDLSGPLPFLTVCIYPIECFNQPAVRDRLPQICAAHSAVIA